MSEFGRKEGILIFAEYEEGACLSEFRKKTLEPFEEEYGVSLELSGSETRIVVYVPDPGYIHRQMMMYLLNITGSNKVYSKDVSICRGLQPLAQLAKESPYGFLDISGWTNEQIRNPLHKSLLIL